MDYALALNDALLRDLGKRLKANRINYNLTQQELAVKSGLSRKTISDFENGHKNISLTNLIEILRVLRLENNLQYLLPELPLFSPIELMEKEKNKTKRVRK